MCSSCRGSCCSIYCNTGVITSVNQLLSLRVGKLWSRNLVCLLSLAHLLHLIVTLHWAKLCRRKLWLKQQGSSGLPLYCWASCAMTLLHSPSQKSSSEAGRKGGILKWQKNLHFPGWIQNWAPISRLLGCCLSAGLPYLTWILILSLVISSPCRKKEALSLQQANLFLQVLLTAQGPSIAAGCSYLFPWSQVQQCKTVTKTFLGKVSP